MLEDASPQAICVHVSTNDIGNNKTVSEIEDEMEELIVLIKQKGILPIISLVLPRNDKHAQKVKLVNDKIIALCSCYNVCYIEHKNIKTEHLNPGGVHLVEKFKQLFTDNLVNHFNYICDNKNNYFR